MTALRHRSQPASLDGHQFSEDTQSNRQADKGRRTPGSSGIWEGRRAPSQHHQVYIAVSKRAVTWFPTGLQIEFFGHQLSASPVLNTERLYSFQQPRGTQMRSPNSSEAMTTEMCTLPYWWYKPWVQLESSWESWCWLLIHIWLCARHYAKCFPYIISDLSHQILRVRDYYYSHFAD